ncbi:NYN domain-containing protein [Sandarakinorhabdus rubra]|uniref:NYN domain-containing protein n=1 Tax=Sandarakinorhabdus rubra TaxID=2672568 RepID=UPI0013DADBA5|nr:NYN domain-containing protein [Sandarakinorhabdus rubra]
MRGKFTRPLAATGLDWHAVPMSTSGGAKRIVVLIDGDNLTGSYADSLFAIIAALGTTSVRRLYGDFQNGRMKDWLAAMDKHAIAAVHVQPTGGKNGTDMALAIDAVDLLHSNRPDIFCIVTSDRDYARLIIRLREADCAVHGFGEAKAPASLANACNHFHRLKGSTAAAVHVSAEPKAASKSVQGPVVQRHPSRAKAWIDAAFEASGSEWLSLSALGTAIRKSENAYLKKTGFASLKKLLTALNDTYEQGIAADGKTAQVRRRKP